MIYGFTHTLVLTRSSSDKNALFRATGVSDGKVNLTNIKWVVPLITPDARAKYDLIKQIQSETILNVGFRMNQCISASVPETTEFTYRVGVRTAPEQPRFIFLAFQTARQEDQEKNYACYDHCDLESAHVSLNNDRYPRNDFQTNFGVNHFDNQYSVFASFIRKFYKVDDSVVSTGIGPLLYKALFPVYIFDVSHQSEKLKTAVTDITLHCRFKKNVTVKTFAHVVIISDRQIRFKTSGGQMSVLY